MNTSSPPSQLLVNLSILHILSSPVNALSIKILVLQRLAFSSVVIYMTKFQNFNKTFSKKKIDFYHNKLFKLTQIINWIAINRRCDRSHDIIFIFDKSLKTKSNCIQIYNLLIMLCISFDL